MNDYDQMRSELPRLPPSMRQRRIEITHKVFVAWDIMEPWWITAVAFLRGDDGEFMVWTPGHLYKWVWRGPSYLKKEDSGLLIEWLINGTKSALWTTRPKKSEHIEMTYKRIWFWNPRPNLDGGFGFLRLDEGGFELSVMMAGLRRGGALIGKEDGEKLAEWLTSHLKSAES